MKKTALIGSLLLAALIVVGSIIYFQKNENKSSVKPELISAASAPVTDYYYYDVELNNGQHYVSKINTYANGKIELYQSFIVIDNKLVPYDKYLEMQQQNTNPGGIAYQRPNPTITVTSADIKSKELLPDDSATIASINAYAEGQYQGMVDRLVAPVE